MHNYKVHVLKVYWSVLRNKQLMKSHDILHLSGGVQVFKHHFWILCKQVHFSTKIKTETFLRFNQVTSPSKSSPYDWKKYLILCYFCM